MLSFHIQPLHNKHDELRGTKDCFGQCEELDLEIFQVACSSVVLHPRLIYISAVYRQYIANISELAMKISFEYISAIIILLYRDWLHSLGTRSAVKILKVFTTSTETLKQWKFELVSYGRTERGRF